MRRMLRILLIASVAVAMAGCSIITKLPLVSRVPERMEDPDAYINPKETDELYIPSDMAHREIVDLWIIPTIADRPSQVLFNEAVPIPPSIVGEADPDLVRIQALGPDRSWMLVQRTPETVWPVVKQWVQDNGLGTAYEDPSQGLIFCNALDLQAQDPMGLLALVSKGKQDAQLTGDDWIAVRLETSMRHGFSEVHIRYLNSAETPDIQVWPIASTNYTVERSVLEALANYDAAGYVAPTASRVGRDISLMPKVETLTDGDGFAVLRLNVDYSRAWATIQRAIANAELTTTNNSSQDGFIEVVVTPDLRGKRSGLFSNFLRRGGSRDSGPETIGVSIVGSGTQFDVSLNRGENVTVEFAQQFLALLRENLN